MWLVLTFTLERTTVINLFAGCGGLGVVCAEQHHCYLCVEYDAAMFDCHLRWFGDIGLTPLAGCTMILVVEDDTIDWEQYEP